MEWREHGVTGNKYVCVRSQELQRGRIRGILKVRQDVDSLHTGWESAKPVTGVATSLELRSRTNSKNDRKKRKSNSYLRGDKVLR